ncbi:MAG: VCBS repeat-containing protein [Ktedonobacteraceae bacterium]|nr:VCBS repeat-containing protein [Ktedonobacteraceae bacterium]
MFSKVWDYKAKNWVTGVYALAIDNDGDVEIIACSRDGRVYVLSKWGDRRWERIIGSKESLRTIIAIPPVDGRDNGVRVITATRNGKVYALNKDGKTVSKDGKLFSFADDGRAFETEQEVAACWLDTGSAIRQVHVNPLYSSDIVLGSADDHHAYALNYKTGEIRWKFATKGWVRAVILYDIDGDGEAETLVGSVDGFLYVLNHEGQCIDKTYMQHPIYAIFAADIDHDGVTEILVATGGKDLIALTPDLREKWPSRQFNNRLVSLYVADVDNDGHDEIIAGSDDKHIYILNGQGNVLWRYNLEYRVLSVYATDFDNDGHVELLAGSEEGKIHVFRVQLIKNLDERIRKCYQGLGGPDPVTLTDLSIDERNLLQDILWKEAIKYISLNYVEQLIEVRNYKNALCGLIELRTQNVQLVWRKDRTEQIGDMRTLCFGYISGKAKKDVVLGTNEGNIRVFSASGKYLCSHPLGKSEISLVQAGYINGGKCEKIVACSTDHQMYIVSGTKRQDWCSILENERMTCFYVTPANKQKPVEIIIGSENGQLSIYGGDLQQPLTTISTPEPIKLVCAHTPKKDDTLEIVAADFKNSVYAYERTGKLLWDYEVVDRIEALYVKDIDQDGSVEVLIGSYGRSLHVLDSKGHLKWRYYLPHGVLAVDAVDMDHDGSVEVLAGCADGYMYVFSREGDLLWKYQANDRIHMVCAQDIDDDGNIEIAVGSEDELELLQVVNQRQVSTLIDQCLSAIQQERSVREVIIELLHDPNPTLCAFALGKFVELSNFSREDVGIFEKFLRDGFVEVRVVLVRAVIASYPIDPQKVASLLSALSRDASQEVKLAFIDSMWTLMQSDWELGFEYLWRFSSYSDRYVRRAVVRKLHQLIDVSQENTRDRAIFELLLQAAQDKGSEWVRQEAARTLAHFLSRHHSGLVVYIHLFLVKELHPSILQLIAHNTANVVAQNAINALALMVRDMDGSNIQEMLEAVVKAFEDMKSLKYGNDNWMIYTELRHLFTIRTIDDIAHYQYVLELDQFLPTNELAPTVLNVFNRLSSISRILRVYLRRDSVNDRVSSLLEATRAIDMMNSFVEREYSMILLEEPISKLPDRRLFELLLKQWREIVNAQLNELRGRPELKVELLTRNVRYEEQIGIWLSVTNTGRAPADSVEVKLLHGDDFDVVGDNSFRIETIFSQEATQLEFYVKPLASSLSLSFEVSYDDEEHGIAKLLFCDRLELQTSALPQEFRHIPNPYSTGTPSPDNKMFFGREQDIAFLKDNLTRPSAQSVIVLYGQRRSGKTTLLLHLLKTPVLEEHIPVLIDMQGESLQISASKFLHNLAFYIAKEVKKRGLSVPQPEQKDFSNDPTFAFNRFLDRVEGELDGQRIILLIDEFEVLEEQIKKGKLEPEILEFLRSLMQHRHNINFLLSGTHKIEQLTKGYWSVFFNIACHHRLSKLNSQAAADLITKPIEGYLEYDSYALKKIQQLTANQPYLIHLMCRSLVDHCDEKRKSYVTINDVNTVLREVMQTGQFHFDWIWEQLSPEERSTLSALAQGGKEEGRQLSLVEVEEVYRDYRFRFRRESIEAALQSLIDSDVVERVSDGAHDNTLDSIRYRIPIGLIRSWLRKEKPLKLFQGSMI